MKSKSIGDILKEERLKHGVDLADLAAQTKIKLKYLKALENNQFDQLPAAPFVKGFIKSYAHLFDFDTKPLLALLRRDYQESTDGQLLPREFINPIVRKNTSSRSLSFIVIVVVAVFLSLMGYVGWQWYTLTRPPRLEVSQPENDQFVSSEIIVEGQTEPESIVLVNAQPVSLRPDGSFRTKLYLPREGISTITVEATDKRGKTNLEQRTVYVKF